jgi:hypothetical protein
MPIDPSIPLQVQTPAPVNPLQTLSVLAQLRGQQTEMALRNAQLAQANAQTQDLQAQADQRNRDLTDNNTIQQALQDPVKAKKLLTGDTSPITGLVTPQSEQKFKIAQQGIEEKRQTLDTTALTNRSTAATQAGQTLAGLQQIAETQGIDAANSAYPGALNGLRSAGVLKNLGVDEGQLPNQFDDVDHIARLAASIGADGALTDKILGNRKTQQEINTSKATADKDSAQALQFKADADKLTADAANARATLPKNQADAQIAQMEADFRSKHGGRSPADVTAAGELGVKQGELGLKNKQFDATYGSGLNEFGQPLSPDALKAAALQDPTAVAIARYELAPPPATLRNGVENPVYRKVMAINPQFSATEFPTRNKVQQDFSASGTSGKAITSADTALAHLDSISKAGAALNNGDIQQLNRLANFVGAQVGQTPKQTYDTIVSMVAPEISKAVIGDSGGEGERTAMKLNFGSNLSPDQREQSIGAAAGLLAARVSKQAHAYESSMGIPLDLEKRLSPGSLAVMNRYGGTATAHGGAAGKITVKAGDGSLHPFDTEAQAAAFETAVKTAGGTTSRQ